MLSAMTTNRLTMILISVLFLLTTLSRVQLAEVGASCKIRTTGSPGICKTSSECQRAEEEAKNGIPPTICGFHQFNIPIVCCEESGFIPNDNTLLNRGDNAESPFIFPDNEPPEPTRRPSRPRLRISDQKCNEYSRNITDSEMAIPLVVDPEAISIENSKCDYDGVALIVGGKPAFAGEFPLMAAVGFIIDNVDKPQWRCGGTLISHHYVLTAAHCTYSRDAGQPKLVRLGELDFESDNDGSVYVDYNIINIKNHPQYKWPEKYNDISLLQLERKVEFTKFIRPACLHTKSIIEEPTAIATGWGKTDFTESEGSSKLMKVSLNIYNNDLCKRTFPKTNNLLQGVRSDMICAGELQGGNDTCQGDSGGPLLITTKANQCKFYIIGITSFGKICGQKNTPAVYTRVSEFVDWIERTIW